jgi:hypothetical protein
MSHPVSGSRGRCSSADKNLAWLLVFEAAQVALDLLERA